jgi:hypothetical protein
MTEQAKQNLLKLYFFLFFCWGMKPTIETIDGEKKVVWSRR